jgi:hypothetical protein
LNDRAGVATHVWSLTRSRSGWIEPSYYFEMLQLMVRRVHAEHVELLRDWLAQVGGPRRTEALQTLVDETTRHEMALLVDAPDGPLLVYAIEVGDPAQSRQAAEHSSHPIDADHRRVMGTALGEEVPSEVLLDIRPN